MRLLCSVLSDRGTTAAKGQIHLSVMKLGRKSLAVCCGVNSHSVLLPIAVTALVRTLVCILFCKHQTFRRCPNSRRLHSGRNRRESKPERTYFAIRATLPPVSRIETEKLSYTHVGWSLHMHQIEGCLGAEVERPCYLSLGAWVPS